MDLAELSMILESIEAKDVSQEEFMSAVQKAKSITTLDNEQQLLLYALFKQSTVGDINVDKPDKSDMVGTFKWKTWKSFEGFPQKNAALAYVYVVTQLLSGNALSSQQQDPSSSSNSNSDANSNEHNGMGAIVSTLFYQYDDSMLWKDSEALFKAVVDNSLEQVQECVTKGADVNTANEEGMTPLHFAADRGYNDIVQYLLTHGAVIDASDSSGQTPLMLAVSCENTDVVATLLEHGANTKIRNSDGVDVLGFEDIPSHILELLSRST